MWLLLGIAAIITALLNLAWTLRKRDAKWFRFISLACTAFTLCAFYTQTKVWVAQEYWSSLMDVVPTLSNVLWFLAIASVAINSISLFQKFD